MANQSNTLFDEFVSGCNDDNILVQMRTIRTLVTVAKSMDHDNVNDKLCPFLTTYILSNIYKAHDVLVLLAQQLGDIVCLVGIENINSVLNNLEELAGIDIIPVRHATVQSILKIAKLLDTAETENILLPRILRLGFSSIPSSKCTASALCSVCYKKVDLYFKDELKKLFKILCRDIFPSVRRTACLHLAFFIEELDMKSIIEEFVPVFEQLCTDDCESVRLLSVDVGISIGMNLFEEDVKTFVLSKIATLSSDTSWKVRCQVAGRMPTIQTAVGSILTREYIVTLFQNLIQDDYHTVREEATKNLFRFSKYLHESCVDLDSDENCDPVIIDNILPLIHILYLDPSINVKEALSSVVVSIFPFIGEQNSKNLIPPLFESYFISDSYKIKQSIVGNLDGIVAVNGCLEISESIFSIMVDLMNSSASAWRTRRDLVCTINCIVRYLDIETFDDNLKGLYLKLLGDSVYGVRRTAPLILPRLIKLYGCKWALSSLLPSIFLFAEHGNYLYRFVYLFCVDELIRPTLNYKDGDSVENDCLMDDDGRVKIEMTVQNIIALHSELMMEFNQEWIKENLELLEKHYPAKDCIDNFAEDALETLNKNHHNIKIFQITPNEVINTKGVYLEEILKLILTQILNALRKLAQDSVLNIQIKTAETLQKINHFNDILGKLLLREFFNGETDGVSFHSEDRISSGNDSQESDLSDSSDYDVYFVTEASIQNSECNIPDDTTDTEVLTENADAESYEQHRKIAEVTKSEENEE